MKKKLWWVLLVVVLGVGGSLVASRMFVSKMTAKPDTLIVTKHDPTNQQNQITLQGSVQDPTQVENLYRKLGELRAPDAENSYNCPEDAGVVYDLKFMQGNHLVEEIQVDVAGCRSIRVIENGRPGKALAILTHTDEYRQLLANALTIPKL